MTTKLLTTVAFAALAACSPPDGTPVASAPAAPAAYLVDPDPAVAAPAMWKVADADTTIYILGTFHVVRPGMDWKTPLIEQAIGEADALVLELSMDPAKMAAQAPQLQALATDEPVEPLKARLSPEQYAKLSAAFATTGMPVEAFDGFETWFLMPVLGGPVLEAAGFSTSEGIDMTLFSTFSAAGKPVEELEGLIPQVTFLDAADEATQQEMLMTLFEDNLAESLDVGLGDWASGDLDALWASMGFEDLSPEATDAMLAKRNPHWADWIQKRLETPGTVLVAGGTGHFMGPHSVLPMLDARGITVTRIQ